MKGKFDLVEETQNDDGTWNLVFDVDDEFQEWFKESQGLKRWSHKRFQKVFHEALINAVELETPGETNPLSVLRQKHTDSLGRLHEEEGTFSVEDGMGKG